LTPRSHDSFDEYARRFSSKRRTNLTRHVKRGELRVWRAIEPSDVPEFLCAAATIAAKSWQKHDSTLPAEAPEWRCFLASLASHNLLRGYVLYRGEAPYAYILGYQFADEFHYWRVGYDPAHASVSPGTVLLYHAIQDLIESGGPRRIEFGIGNFEYKRHFGNAQRVMLGVLLFRRTLRNRGMIVAHRAFRLAVKTARWVLRRPPA
jgi:CelD/BcsL family acetyltransferase involved in cellulose biosynthesis